MRFRLYLVSSRQQRNFVTAKASGNPFDRRLLTSIQAARFWVQSQQYAFW